MGMREIGEINCDRAYYLRQRISKLKNFEVDTAQPVFNEFRVISKRPFSKIEEKLKAQRIFPGVSLEKFYPELKDQFLVCATETKSKEDLDRFAGALSQC
jgi:glycine dehydrogenase subunit 1